MKKLWYKLLTLAVMLCAFAGRPAVVGASSYQADDLTAITENYMNSWNVTDFSTYLESGDLSESDAAIYQQWQDLKGILGEFDAITGTVNTEENGEIISVCSANFANGSMTLTITYDTAVLDQYGVENANYAVKSIVAEQAGGSSSKPDMGKAGLNTLMGMGTVFVVLILISLVIAALKPVTDIILGTNKKKPEPVLVKNEPVMAEPALEEDLTDDAELVAVVTAAIMASSDEIPAGGLRVRSIRRRRG